MNYPIDTRKFERFVTFGKKKKDHSKFIQPTRQNL